MKFDPSASIGPDQTINLRLNSNRDAHVAPLEPFSAASLGRELLSCAIATLSTNSPPIGTIVGTADVPVYKTAVRLDADGRIVVELGIPIDPGIGFTFRMAPAVAGHLARELTKTLLADSEGA